jgi:uncharacterized protein involved in exopolysaccharide biosynthesis/Mrp family chromosome partitioning ATPase
LDDVLYTLFRHKLLILGFCCLGIVGVAAVRILKPPLYVSKAELMVHYVPKQAPATGRPSPDSPDVHATDTGGQATMDNEVEILKSRDVAVQAVDILGPERILDGLGGGTNREWAAGVVASGIQVDPPRTSVINVSFKHRNARVAPIVLGALIQAYVQKSRDVNEGTPELDRYYRQQVEEMRRKLADTEEELKRLKRQANVIFVDDTKKTYQEQISKAQSELMDAQRQLAEQKALLVTSSTGATNGVATNALDNAVPAEKLTEYGDLLAELETLKKNERELLLSYKEAYPLVQTVRGQIEKFAKQKAELEMAFPSLAGMGIGAHASTNTIGGDVRSQFVGIRVLEARVRAQEAILTNIQAQAAQVMELEPKIAEVTRRRDEDQKNYEYLLKQIEKKHNAQTATTGEANGISMVQSPTPPAPDIKKMLKLIGIVFAGCAGMGLGLAFLIDLVVDRSIKRPIDVEKHLRLPVFLNIPDTAPIARSVLPPWLARWWQNGRNEGRATAVSGNGGEAAPTDLAPWEPGHELDTYTEGLRERLMTYFEVNNLNLKKPKLVAVAGCSPGAGVTTLATGLAASLSKTGDGNVLLVDMNVGQGVAHSFYHGKPGCGLTEALEPRQRSDALLQENLYVATMGQESSDKLMKVMPTRFTHLVPKLKASDYDYIIFDMPPVSQTSMTPRLASYMDMVLLVLESEKTRQHAAAKAGALMRESRANVAAVLNKCHAYVPAGLSPDA